MGKNKLLTTLAIVSIALVAFFTGCNKNEWSGNNSDSSPLVKTNDHQTQGSTTVPLAGASNFAVFAGSAITSTGATSVTGDLGLSPGTSVGGFPPGILVGSQHVNDPVATQAKLDLTTAYNNAAGRTSTDIVTLSGNIGGLTLTPGLYKSTSSLAISSGDLTFDAKGNASAVFIIQIASSLTTTSGRKVILSGGALASNIFWQVGNSAKLDGRALTRNGGVTMGQAIPL